MDTTLRYQTRRQRLRELIDTRYEGVTTRFAAAAGLRPPQVFRWLSETGTRSARNMESESARKIERALGLLEGWLDSSPDVCRISVPVSVMCLAIRFVREAESRGRTRFSDDDFCELTRAVAEWATELDEAITAEEEHRFKAMLAKLIPSLARARPTNALNSE